MTPTQATLEACSLDTLRQEAEVSFEEGSRTITPISIDLQAESKSY